MIIRTYTIDKKTNQKLNLNKNKLDMSHITDIHESVNLIAVSLIMSDNVSGIDDLLSWDLQNMFLLSNLMDDEF